MDLQSVESLTAKAWYKRRVHIYYPVRIRLCYALVKNYHKSCQHHKISFLPVKLGKYGLDPRAGAPHVRAGVLDAGLHEEVRYGVVERDVEQLEHVASPEVHPRDARAVAQLAGECLKVALRALHLLRGAVQAGTLHEAREDAAAQDVEQAPVARAVKLVRRLVQALESARARGAGALGPCVRCHGAPPNVGQGRGRRFSPGRPADNCQGEAYP